MTEPAAIKGTFSDYKLIKTRKVIQIIVEVSVEQQAQVFAALGYPMPDSETWVAVARLDLEKAKASPATPEKVKRPFHDLPLSQQAGIRCHDKGFQEFLRMRYGAKCAFSDSAAIVVRRICGKVESRARFDDTSAGVDWTALNAEFEKWAGLTAEQRS